MWDDEVEKFLTDNKNNDMTFESYKVFRDSRGEPEKAEIVLKLKSDVEICLKKDGGVNQLFCKQ